jgi:hypothetical protein
LPKSPPLGVRVESNIKDALVRAAKDDVRTISSMAEKIIAEWLICNGYLVSAIPPAVEERVTQFGPPPG